MYLYSFAATEGGKAQTVSASGTSAQSTAFNGPTKARIYSTVDVFFRRGSNPTAVTTDSILPAYTMFRVTGIKDGDKLAFITGGGTGTVYITRED